MAEVDGLLVQIEASTARLRSELARGERSVQATTGRMEQHVAKLERSFDGLGGKLTGVLAGIGVGISIKSIIDTNVEFQRMRASLVTLTGSAENADKALSALEDFATKTPYQLNEVVGAFTKLKALGLDATEESLISFGNTASAMGKGLDQFIEAVADAATGEFERLKEFGIKASSEGNKVSFTFQGITTTVRKNAADIQAYLVNLGKVQFAGAMERQMETVGGAMSNLGDAFAKVQRQIGEGGLNDALIEFNRQLTSAAGGSETIAKQIGANLGGAVRGAVPAIQTISSGIAAMFETFNNLPMWVQEIGIAGALLGGKKIRALIGLGILVDQVANKLEEIAPLGSIEIGDPDLKETLDFSLLGRTQPAKPRSRTAAGTSAGRLPSPLSGSGGGTGGAGGGGGGGGGTDTKKFDKVTDDLKAERAELTMTSRERFVATQLRKLDADATDEQIAQVRALAEAYWSEKSAIDARKLASEQAAEVAAKDDEARAKASERAKEIIADKNALNKALDDELERAQAALDMSTMTERARRIENRLLEEKVKWQEKGIPLIEKELELMRQRVGKLVDTEMATESNTEAMQYLEQVGERAFDRIGSSITEAFVQGEGAAVSFRGVMQGVVSEILQDFMKLAMLNPLKNAIFGGSAPTLASVGGIFGGLSGKSSSGSNGSGGSNGIVAGEHDWLWRLMGNGVGGIFGSIGAVFREQGGPVYPGKAYVVGEKRPELFVPSTPGVILPRVPTLAAAGSGAGGGPQSVTTYNIDARGADVAAVARLEAMVRNLDKGLEARAVKSVVNINRRGTRW